MPKGSKGPGPRAAIAGMGIYVPDRVLTNEDLEKMVDTSDQWITERTGIKERRIAAPNEASSDMALEAARQALEDAAVSPGEVDLIITATNTPDMLFPATACLVQDRLGVKNAGAFDLLAGCTGFIYGLSVGSQFISAGTAKTVLVIGTESLSKVTDWKNRNTCVLFGDGAGAVVLRPSSGEYGIVATKLGSDGSGGMQLCQPAGGSRMPATRETVDRDLHTLHMNGRDVFKFAVKAMVNGPRDVLREAGLGQEDIDFLIPHQANTRIIDHAAKKLNLSPERIMVNVDRYGNTSTASIPLALYEAYQQGRLNDGDNVVLVAFGAGLTWAASLIKWHDYQKAR